MFRENTFLTKGAKKLESESALGAPATEPLMTLEDIEGRADTPINRVLEDQEEKVAALDEIQHLKLIYNIADRLKIKPVDAQDLVAQATKTPDGEINFELVIKYYNRETSDLLQKDPKFEEFYKDYLKEQLILKKLEWEVQNKASYEPRLSKIQYLIDHFDTEIAPNVRNEWNVETYIKLVNSPDIKDIKDSLRKIVLGVVAVSKVFGVGLETYSEMHNNPALNTMDAQMVLMIDNLNNKNT